jgi:hypothetical protein
VNEEWQGDADGGDGGGDGGEVCRFPKPLEKSACQH